MRKFKAKDYHQWQHSGRCEWNKREGPLKWPWGIRIILLFIPQKLVMLTNDINVSFVSRSALKGESSKPTNDATSWQMGVKRQNARALTCLAWSLSISLHSTSDNHWPSSYDVHTNQCVKDKNEALCRSSSPVACYDKYQQMKQQKQQHKICTWSTRIQRSYWGCDSAWFCPLPWRRPRRDQSIKCTELRKTDSVTDFVYSAVTSLFEGSFDRGVGSGWAKSWRFVL